MVMNTKSDGLVWAAMKLYEFLCLGGIRYWLDWRWRYSDKEVPCLLLVSSNHRILMKNVSLFFTWMALFFISPLFFTVTWMRSLRLNRVLLTNVISCLLHKKFSLTLQFRNTFFLRLSFSETWIRFGHWKGLGVTNNFTMNGLETYPK